ncbi:MAG TPA: response regulator [Minicystis sp.]|nr:response regulator [Minicystis sp.]
MESNSDTAPHAASTVLVVDDNPQMLESTARYLRSKGLEVLTADSPFGVSKLVSRNAPAVVVLDVMMPALDGKNLADLLRQNPLTCSADIVFYSALEEEAVYRIARNVPGSHYALKSDGPDALLQTVRSCLAKRA